MSSLSNAVSIAELAIDKQAQTLLMPVSARRQLNELPDDLWTRISIEFYKDAADAVFKALVELLQRWPGGASLPVKCR